MEKTTSQTGPKSQEGKARSAQNSLKFGIFSSSILQGEDANAVKALVDNLRVSFALTNGAGELLANRFVHTNLQLNRVQKAQLAIANGKYFSNKSREQFCIHAGHYFRNAEDVPAWYFEEDHAKKDHVFELQDIFDEAHHLKNHYSADLMVKAEMKLPSLWKFVMGEKGDPRQKMHTLGEQLAALYKRPNAILNIQDLITDLEARYKYELLWAQNAQRYEAIIDGLRSQAILDTLIDPGLVRAESMLHRRSQELLSTMHLLSQQVPRLASKQTPAIEVTAKGKPIDNDASGNPKRTAGLDELPTD
jgi:hypothetical protein